MSFYHKDFLAKKMTFVNLQCSADLKNVHKQLFEDLDLMGLGMEFNNVLNMEDAEDFIESYHSGKNFKGFPSPINCLTSKLLLQRSLHPNHIAQMLNV